MPKIHINDILYYINILQQKTDILNSKYISQFFLSFFFFYCIWAALVSTKD